MQSTGQGYFRGVHQVAESNKNPESASQVGAPVPPLGRDGVAICSFEQAFAVLPVIVWESDWTGPDDIPRLTYVSASAERILGYPIHLWLEDPSFIISIIHPEDRDRVAYDVQRSSALSGSPAAVFRCLAADGGVVWLEGRYAATYDGEGRVIGLRGVNIDVTDRMRAEAELGEWTEFGSVAGAVDVTLGTPYTLPDAARALRVAGGLTAATPSDMARLGTAFALTGKPCDTQVTLADAIGIARSAFAP